MKSLQKKSVNAVLILSILAIALSGCGGGSSDSGGSSEANVGTFFLCLISLGYACPARNEEANTDPTAFLPPTVTKLSASVSSTAPVPEIGLNWQAAADEDHILGYRIYRDGEPIADTWKTEFTDSVVAADTRYCYQVTAYDESRVESLPGEPACSTTSWVISTVDVGITGPLVALALDSQEQVHFAYLGYDSEGAADISYANRLTDQWNRQHTGFVASAMAEDLSLVIDATGAAHIGSLERYITNVFGDWQMDAREAHNFAAFSIDSRGYLHAVSGDGKGGFEHATNTGGGWYYEPLGEGEWKRLAAIVDDFDVMHVAYYNYAARELRYLDNHSGSWSGEVIATNIGPVWHLDLAVDIRGRAHLVYQLQPEDDAARQAGAESTRSGLVYASNAGGRWQSQFLDPGVITGCGAAIAVDRGGFLHISYNGPGGRDLRYLTNFSGSWVSTVIDDVLPVDAISGLLSGLCAATDIAVDTRGGVHIGYPAGDRVMYAARL